MADYIKASILCQSYVHTETTQDFAAAVNTIKEKALPLIATRARFFLYEDAELSFDPQQGSLKSRITIFGTLALALQGITQYKDFREGVTLLYSDVQRVAEMATTETLFALKARGQQIKRTELRVGIVGSLHRIIGAIDAAEADPLDKSIKIKAQDLESIRRDILKLMDNINDAEDVELVGDELYLLAKKIPEQPTPGRRDPHALDNIQLYKGTRRELLASIKSAKSSRVRALNE